MIFKRQDPYVNLFTEKGSRLALAFVLAPLIPILLSYIIQFLFVVVSGDDFISFFRDEIFSDGLIVLPILSFHSVIVGVPLYILAKKYFDISLFLCVFFNFIGSILCLTFYTFLFLVIQGNSININNVFVVMIFFAFFVYTILVGISFWLIAFSPLFGCGSSATARLKTSQLD